MKKYRGLLTVLVLPALIAGVTPAPGNDDGQGSQAAEREAFIQRHRAFWFLSAVVEDQKVHLSFSRAHWYNYIKEYNFDDIFANIRIYRREVDFNWAWDRSEVMDSLVCTLGPEDVIYKGPIEPKYVYKVHLVYSRECLIDTTAGWCTFPRQVVELLQWC